MKKLNKRKGLVCKRSFVCEQLLGSYDEYLTRFLGLSEATRDRYLFFADRFVCWQQQLGIVSDWTKLTGAEVADFVRSETKRLTGAGRRAPLTATRSVLRFLVSQGLVAAGLENALPRYRQYRHASLPVHLSELQISQALGIWEATTASGLRNRAILLLLSRLGIRAKEVIELCLEDINWIEGKLTIRSAKSLRQRVLPLPRDVGQALVDYLLRGRGDTNSRSVFLRVIPPYSALTGADAISQIVHRTLNRAGIHLPRMGAHVFRHTAATQMLCRGASFKEIADVLGHKCIETTGIYAKLDLDSLASVALPWPGGAK